MGSKEEMDANITECTTSKGFTFSRPNVVFSPSKMLNYISNHLVSPATDKQAFSFAAPETISHFSNYINEQSDDPETKYASKLSRNAFEPSAILFASALQDTLAYKQLKKNSKSSTTKLKIEHSLTCTNVPKELLMKSSAKEYFTSYGHTMKITIRPKKTNNYSILCIQRRSK